MNMSDDRGDKSCEILIGRFNRMKVVKEVDFGVYLDGGEAWGEILLPMKAVPQGTKPNDEVEVLVYFDSEDRPIATTVKPRAIVGDFVAMEVKDRNQVGAFLEWGIPGKDLLLPFKEQTRPVKVKDRVVVYVKLDSRQGRIIATMRWDKFVTKDSKSLKPWQKVSLLICRRTDIGYPAIINNSRQGLLFANEVFETLNEGDEKTGYIKGFRDDGKIDLSLHNVGYQKVEASLEAIMEKLVRHNGFIAVTDKSSPEEVYKLFSISKKTYKKSVGALFKQGLITLDSDGIRLVQDE